MKRLFWLLPLGLGLIGCNKKIEDLDSNNVEFQETYTEINEIISINVPNAAFDFSGFLNCTSLPFGLSQDYSAFIPTQNPNPYAHLVDNITPTSVKMELTNIPDCDFDMLESMEIFLVDLVDSCGSPITDENQFVLPSDNVSYTGSCSSVTPEGTYFNAVKLGEYLNFTSGVGNVIYLDVEPGVQLDQFIHAGNFQTYAKLVFDKAFTEESAIIKTTMALNVRIVNAE